ncbi:MAG: tetratricopeptide repeat protein [Acidobacteriota bacterium]|nr:MAG: tetratricopeptide repeat protein [Acidobacteriota bacterium]
MFSALSDTRKGPSLNGPRLVCLAALSILISLSLQPDWVWCMQRQSPLPRPSKNAQPDAEGPAGRRPVPNLRSVHFIGGLVMDDGSALPGELWIELVCHGRIMKQVPVDPQGGFELELGSSVDVDWADPSVSGNAGSPTSGLWTPRYTIALTSTALRGCELRLAPIVGYTADSINVSSLDLGANPDVGIIVVHKQGPRTGVSSVSLTTLKAPDRARRSLEKAKKEFIKAQPDLRRVVQETERAIKEYPGFTEAWYLLGLAREREQDRDGAREAFQRAIQTDEKHIASYFELARIEMGQGNWPRACELTRQLLELEPALPQVLYFNGMAHYYAGDTLYAELSLRSLVAHEQAAPFPMTYFFLAMIDRERQEFQLSAEEFRKFLELAGESEAPAGLRSAVEQQLVAWSEEGLITD